MSTREEEVTTQLTAEQKGDESLRIIKSLCAQSTAGDAEVKEKIAQIQAKLTEQTAKLAEIKKLFETDDAASIKAKIDAAASQQLADATKLLQDEIARLKKEIEQLHEENARLCEKTAKVNYSPSRILQTPSPSIPPGTPRKGGEKDKLEEIIIKAQRDGLDEQATKIAQLETTLEKEKNKVAQLQKILDSQPQTRDGEVESQKKLAEVERKVGEQNMRILDLVSEKKVLCEQLKSAEKTIAELSEQLKDEKAKHAAAALKSPRVNRQPEREQNLQQKIAELETTVTSLKDELKKSEVIIQELKEKLKLVIYLQQEPVQVLSDDSQESAPSATAITPLDGQEQLLPGSAELPSQSLPGSVPTIPVSSPTPKSDQILLETHGRRVYKQDELERIKHNLALVENIIQELRKQIMDITNELSEKKSRFKKLKEEADKIEKMPSKLKETFQPKINPDVTAEIEKLNKEIRELEMEFSSKQHSLEFIVLGEKRELAAAHRLQEEAEKKAEQEAKEKAEKNKAVAELEYKQKEELEKLWKELNSLRAQLEQAQLEKQAAIDATKCEHVAADDARRLKEEAEKQAHAERAAREVADKALAALEVKKQELKAAHDKTLEAKEKELTALERKHKEEMEAAKKDIVEREVERNELLAILEENQSKAKEEQDELKAVYAKHDAEFKLLKEELLLRLESYEKCYLELEDFNGRLVAEIESLRKKLTKAEADAAEQKIKTAVEEQDMLKTELAGEKEHNKRALEAKEKELTAEKAHVAEIEAEKNRVVAELERKQKEEMERQRKELSDLRAQLAQAQLDKQAAIDSTKREHEAREQELKDQLAKEHEAAEKAVEDAKRAQAAADDARRSQGEAERQVQTELDAKDAVAKELAVEKASADARIAQARTDAEIATKAALQRQIDDAEQRAKDAIAAQQAEHALRVRAEQAAAAAAVAPPSRVPDADPRWQRALQMAITKHIVSSGTTVQQLRNSHGDLALLYTLEASGRASYFSAFKV